VIDSGLPMGEETVHQKLRPFGQGRSVGHGRASAELGTRRKRGKKAERADALLASRAATGQDQCQQNAEPRLSLSVDDKFATMKSF
jgi:hypothetical protein